ncbi:MAG: hypothetical protein ACREA0_03670 [bacterium]
MNKEQFLKARLGRREVVLQGVGTVVVRGLSRAEAFRVRECIGADAMERKVIELGLLDPSLDADEVLEWYQCAPAGEVDLLSNAIQELSGLTEGAPKSGLPEV